MAMEVEGAEGFGVLVKQGAEAVSNDKHWLLILEVSCGFDIC